MSLRNLAPNGSETIAKKVQPAIRQPGLSKVFSSADSNVNLSDPSLGAEAIPEITFGDDSITQPSLRRSECTRQPPSYLSEYVP